MLTTEHLKQITDKQLEVLGKSICERIFRVTLQEHPEVLVYMNEGMLGYSIYVEGTYKDEINPEGVHAQLYFNPAQYVSLAKIICRYMPEDGSFLTINLGIEFLTANTMTCWIGDVMYGIEPDGYCHS